MKILLVSIDNLRSDCVSWNNACATLKVEGSMIRKPRTQTLDDLCSEGAFFSNCFSAAPYTTSSHASILTGVYPGRHGIREYYRTGLSKDIKTILQRFKQEGYKTVFYTDFPFLLGPILDFTRDVDEYIINDESNLNKYFNDDNQNIFIFAHFGSVHNPFGLTSLRYDEDYFIQKVEELASRIGIPVQTKTEKEWIEKNYSEHEKLLRQRYIKGTDYLYNNKRYTELMDLYVEGVEYFDGHRFKQFTKAVQESGFLKNGAACILADHGEEYSERSFAHHNGLWDTIVNVPLIFVGSEMPKGSYNNSICRTVDVVPTLLDLAGIEYKNSEFDGQSLCQMFNSTEEIREAYGETWFGYPDRILDFMHMCKSNDKLLKSGIMASTRMEYCRNSEWKLIINTKIESNEEKVLLFSIEQDSMEENDLSSEYPEVVQKLKEKILEQRNRGFNYSNLQVRREEADEIKKGLQSLGYIK